MFDLGSTVRLVLTDRTFNWCFDVSDVRFHARSFLGYHHHGAERSGIRQTHPTLHRSTKVPSGINNRAEDDQWRRQTQLVLGSSHAPYPTTNGFFQAGNPD